MRFKIAVLISGNGSNLQAIIDAIESKNLQAEIAVVVSDQPTAFGLQRAQRHAIGTEVLSAKSFKNREEYDVALQKLLDNYKPDLIVLAGFMRILSPGFVQHYQGKLINIHPSLLPKHRGLHTHEKVLAAGETEHGVTIHFVTEELDGGPIIVQESIPVSSNETVESLKERIHAIEHHLYPKVIQDFVENKIKFK